MVNVIEAAGAVKDFAKSKDGHRVLRRMGAKIVTVIDTEVYGKIKEIYEERVSQSTGQDGPTRTGTEALATDTAQPAGGDGRHTPQSSDGG